MVDTQVAGWLGRFGLDRPSLYLTTAHLVLVVLLAMALADLTLGLLAPATPPAKVASIAFSDGQDGPGPGTDLKRVAALHLFGRPATSDQPAAVPVVDAPKTKLNLTLHGIVPAIDGGEPFALIADGRGDEQPYRRGDALPGGARVDGVHADRVLLKRGGRLETLFLTESTEPRTASASSSRPNPTGKTPPTNRALAARLGRFRDRLLSNPSSAWKSVSVQPVREGDTIKGYRIEPKRGGRLLSQAGLQKGDVVTAVNGIALSDASQVGQVIKQISTAERLNLKIERNGAPQVLQIDIGKR